MSSVGKFHKSHCVVTCPKTRHAPRCPAVSVSVSARKNSPLSGFPKFSLVRICFPSFLYFYTYFFFCGIFRIDFPGRIMNFSRVSLAFPCRQLAPYPFPASGNRTHICQAHSNWTRGRPNAVPEYILIYQLFLHSKHESIALPLSLSRNSPGVIGVIRIKSNNSKRFNPFDPTHSRISGAL